MKITVNAQKLRETLAIGARSALTKPTMPVLGCVLLEAIKAEQRLYLSSTNLDIGVRVSLPVEVDEDFCVALNAPMLLQIAANMPGEEITFTKSKSEQCTVTSARSNFKLYGMPADEFPRVASVEVGEPLSFSQAELASRLSAVSHAQSRDETRFILNGVYISNKDSKQTLVATDGRRLHVYVSPSTSTLEVAAILPSSGVQKLLGFLKGDGKCRAWITERKASFRIDRADGDIVLVSKVVEGTYPNFKQVIPKREHYLEFTRDELADSVSRVAMVTTEKGASMKLSVDGEEATLSAASPDLGEAKETLGMKNTSKTTGSVAFNPAFLAQAIDAVEAEKVELSLDEKSPEISPVVVRSGGFTAVVMPVRLS